MIYFLIFILFYLWVGLYFVIQYYSYIYKFVTNDSESLSDEVNNNINKSKFKQFLIFSVIILYILFKWPLLLFDSYKT